MQMFELMASSESNINKICAKLPKLSKNRHSVLNRSRSNEPFIYQKPPKFARSNTVSNLPNTNLNEPKFDNRLPSSFFKPKNIYPDLDDLISTLNKLKQKEIKKKFEPAPWQHSTFKNNPLHCNSSEFEDYDDKLKIENYKTYGDIDRNALKITQNSTMHRKQLMFRTRRIRKRPKNKRYKKRKRIKKKNKRHRKKKAGRNKSHLFDSFGEVKLKKVVKKNHSKFNTTRVSKVGKKRIGIFSCCFDRESQNRDYYLVIPESQVGTFKPTMMKEQNFFIVQTNPEPKKSLKLHKKRKPLLGQNLFHNDISSIIPDQIVANNQLKIDEFTSITKFNESGLSVMKHIYKLYTSDTINFFDDKTYIISKSNGSTSTRRVRNFFMNTSPEYDNNAEFIPQFDYWASAPESTKTNLENRNGTKSMSCLSGLIHKYEDKIQDGHQNELKMHQGANFLKADEMSKSTTTNETRNRNMCYRSKTLAPISRPISNNFALINSNLTEIENILKNPKPEEEFNLDLKKGLHDWSLWRSKFNETLIKSCFTPAKLKKSIQTHNDLRLKSQSYIEPSFVHYSSHYGEDTNLDPESFMFYGLPRARINRKASLAEEESDQLTVEERLDSTESPKQIAKKITRSASENRAPVLNLIKGMEIFEHSPKKSINRKYSAPDSEKFIESKHVYRQEPEKHIKMMAMPIRDSKEVLKAADGDIIFHSTNQKIQKVDESFGNINCLGKTKHKGDEDKKKNYFNPLKNMLRSKSKTKSSKESEQKKSKEKSRKSENNTVRRRKREHTRKSSIRLSKRKKPDFGKSRNGKRNQRSIRTKKGKSRNLNYQIFNPGNYQAYPTRKSPFFITNNTAQNIEYFTHHILDSSCDISQFDKDIIDLSSSSSSTLSSKSTDTKFKSKVVRERTKRHFDRIKKEKCSTKNQNLSDKNLKSKISINSRESTSVTIAPPPPPEIETIPKRRSSQISKSSIPLVQPALPQVPPPSLSKFCDINVDEIAIETFRGNLTEKKKVGLRRMKVTEEKIEFEKMEIIHQENGQKEKKNDEREKYPNLFKLPKLRYTPQMDASILSTTTLSNTGRTRPKTSKEILQEISRLTNGTSIKNKLNFTFQNNSSDFDTSIMSSNNSKLIQK